MDLQVRAIVARDAAAEALKSVVYSPDALLRRQLGAYYTPQSVAEYMADWVVRESGEHVLEPSFGDGTFLHALANSASRRDLRHLRISAVEIDEGALLHVVRDEHPGFLNFRCQDFLTVAPFRVGAILGNPPYVRLRYLEEAARKRALDSAEFVLGQPMEPSGSLWMPFVLHSLRFLKEGGRLALVLPYDATYVRYARPLWEVLGNSFGSLQVLRTHERMFPDLMQDVVVLLADDFGGACGTLTYRVFEDVSDLIAGKAVVMQSLEVRDLVAGKRVFVAALLRPELHRLLETRIAKHTVPARELVTFNIGYVTGDKDFFHPGAGEIAEYTLPRRSLHSALTSARAMRYGGLWSSALPPGARSALFVPDPAALTEGEARYIQQGVERGVSKRFKCRVRKPWFVVPGIRVPDLLLSVFAERPKLMLNDAELYASNSLLCGYCTGASREQIAAAWYTSLTLLMCELEVHALGGGVMVMIPGEAGNLRIPASIQVEPGMLESLDALLRDGDMESAYAFGDQCILIEQLGFTRDDVDLIHEGIAVLAYWRTAGRSSPK